MDHHSNKPVKISLTRRDRDFDSYVPTPSSCTSQYKHVTNGRWYKWMIRTKLCFLNISFVKAVLYSNGYLFPRAPADCHSGYKEVWVSIWAIEERKKRKKKFFGILFLPPGPVNLRHNPSLRNTESDESVIVKFFSSIYTV